MGWVDSPSDLVRVEEPQCWVEARSAKAAELGRQINACIARVAAADSHVSDLVRHLAWLEAEQARTLEDPAWIAPRPSRSMPNVKRIAVWWAAHEPDLGIDLAEPRCFRCGADSESWRDLERAHIVDRALNGLDHESNLALLCPPCHRVMPMFWPEHSAAALEYAHGADIEH